MERGERRSPRLATALQVELEQSTLEGLRSLAIGALLLGATLAPFDVLRLAAPLKLPALFHDLFVIAAAALPVS